MKTNLRTRVLGGLATGLLVAAPMVAFAPSAAAMYCGDGTDDCNVVIGGEDGYAAITTLSGDLGDLVLEDEDLLHHDWPEGYDWDAQVVELDPSVVNEDGELDRSHLARVQPMEGEEIETGEGYENIVPISGEIGIEPISADVEDGGNAWILPAAITVVAVAGGALGIVAGRRKKAAAA